MKILVAVDGSEYSHAAIEEAARTPWPEGSVVKFISVAEIPVAVTPLSMSKPPFSFPEWNKILEERALARTTQAMAQFVEIAGWQTETTAKTLRGDPKTAILDEAEQWGADLIIVGTHGYNAMERLWLGSVSRAVAAHSKCSVEIVRRRKAQDASRHAMKILLAVDGSESSNAAVEEIASRPWPYVTEVNVIFVLYLPFTPTPETRALPECYYSQLEKAGREQAELGINRIVSRLRESNSEREIPLTLTSEVILGHPEERIIEKAGEWGADLVVVGTHVKRGVERFLLRSVSQAVSYHAPCSVEIVCKKPQNE